MKTKDAAAHFGSKYKLAQALGIDRANITHWKAQVPAKWAVRLHHITEGKLRFNVNNYKP